MQFRYENRDNVPLAKTRISAFIPKPLWEFATRAMPGEPKKKVRQAILSVFLGRGDLGSWYYTESGLRFGDPYDFDALEVYEGPDIEISLAP